MILALARELGYASANKMLQELTPSELGEWIAEYTLSPWGEWRADFRVAQLAALYANSHRNEEAKAEPFVPKDFMFDGIQEQQKLKQESKTMSARIRAGFAHLIKRKKKG